MQLQPCAQGNGLFATAAAELGDVVLSVPVEACVMIDYAAGMRLPAGDWPRLRKGIAKDDSLPWDILQVCAAC